MINFPVLERLRVTNYRLFPGTSQKPNVSFDFQSGISIWAGVNGLGKTTLINILFRLLVGPWELPKDDASRRFGGAAREKAVEWDERRRYFTVRVADKAINADASLIFRVGSQRFYVKRSLRDCSLIEASRGPCIRNGRLIPLRASNPTLNPITQPDGASPETALQNAFVEAAGVTSFVDLLTIIKYLTFFNEDRRDILWDEQAQRQFYRILFAPPEISSSWRELEVDISKADSRARNFSSIASQVKEELDALVTKLKLNKGVGAQLSKAEETLAADIDRRDSLESTLHSLESKIKDLQRDVQVQKLNEDDALKSLEDVRYTALFRLFPTLDDTARYILTHLYAKGICLACEADRQDLSQKFEELLEKHFCLVCGAPPELQRRVQQGGALVGPETLEFARIQSARETLANAKIQRHAAEEELQSTEAEWRRTLTELTELSTKVASQEVDVEQLRAKLPPDPEEVAHRRQTYSNLKKSQEDAEKLRAQYERKYELMLRRSQAAIRAATKIVAVHFRVLATDFLEEECDLTYETVSDRPSQNGRFFDYVGLRFEMTAAAFTDKRIRRTPDDVSESQREFIDLAFRMALMETAAGGGPSSLVIETPEASLDVIFMRKAGDLLRTFASGQRRVVITSNLTNTEMIPSLLGPIPRRTDAQEKRRQRLLDMMEISAPNAAVRHFGPQYRAFLRETLSRAPA